MGDHRLERAQERYAIPFSKYDLARCERLIAEGRSVLVERQSSGSSVHIVKHSTGLAMICVTAANGAIMTFLPPHALNRGARKAHYADNAKRSRKAKRWQLKPDGL